MQTDAALLAALQTLWRAAVPPIVPPAVSTDPPPESTPATAVANKSEVADVGRDRLDQVNWILAENAAGQIGIERDDVPPESRWWRTAMFDHLRYADGRLPQLHIDDGDPFDSLDDEAREYLLGPHRFPDRCGFCGGRSLHNPDCIALCDEWAVAMPFGKHKGQPIRSLETDYLNWLFKRKATLTSDVAHEIERVLLDRQKELAA
jgi:hypothetical protein